MKKTTANPKARRRRDTFGGAKVSTRAVIAHVTRSNVNADARHNGGSKRFWPVRLGNEPPDEVRLDSAGEKADSHNRIGRDFSHGPRAPRRALDDLEHGGDPESE